LLEALANVQSWAKERETCDPNESPSPIPQV